MMGELNANKAARALLLRTLLTEEFLLLPDKVEKLQENVSELKQDMTEVKQDVSELKRDMIEVKQDVSELKRDMIEVKQDVSELKRDMIEVKQDVSELKQDVSRLKVSVNRIEDDMGYLKGDYAFNITQRGIRRLARTVNCWFQEQLNDDDLDKLAHANDTTSISKGELESFRNADFVLTAVHRDTRETQYIVVEASFTGQAYDVRRAVRNAEYLTRFTGHPAHAVVSAVQITPEVEVTVAEGTVVWYQIPPKEQLSR